MWGALPATAGTVKRIWPIALLATATLVFYWKIAFTGLVLVGYDTFAYFYPYLSAASTALRGLRLPLWNPDVFMGAPLAANLQTALFYPSTLLYLLLPTPQALAFDIILHTFLAGAFTYLLARHGLGLARVAALTAATTFAFSGFFAAQAGHVNQVRAAVWLPLLLLFFDRAIHRRSLGYALASGMVIALTLLAGHSQEAYMILCALGGFAVWTTAGATGRALRLGQPPGTNLAASARLAARMLVSAARANAHTATLLAVAALAGGALAAIQLVPSLELARLSVRSGGMSYRQAVSFSLSPLLLPQALLPGYWQNPFSEYIGYVGVAGILLAGRGIAANWRNPRMSFFVALAAVGLILALGGYTPAYIVGYVLVPGFGLFRVPARWLYLYTFGMAMLAGLGVQGLISAAQSVEPPPGLGRWPRLGAHLTALSRRLQRTGALQPLALGIAALWATHALRLPAPAAWLAVGLAAAWLILGSMRARPAAARRSRWTLVALLVVELFAASRDMEYNRPAPPESVSALRPALAHLLTDDSEYRMLSLSLGLFDPGDLTDMRLMMPAATASDFATAAKNKEILAPNTPMLFGIQSMDGYDGGILPLKRYVELQEVFLNPWEITVDGRLRESLDGIPSPRLLSLLNVKYIVADKVQDAWVDNVYYDLGNAVTISATKAAWALGDIAPFPTGQIGIVSYLRGAPALADSAAVAAVTIRDVEGRVDSYILRAGRDTSEAPFTTADVPPQHAQARTVPVCGGEPSWQCYLGTLSLERTQVPASIQVRYLAAQGQLVLRGLSQVDPRTGASQPLAVSEDGALRLVHGGDTKIYENTEVLARAFVVHQAQVLQTNRAVLDALKDPGFDPAAAVVLTADGMDVAPLQSLSGSAGDAVRLVSVEPERIEIAATLGGNGLLVLTDMWYPGWKAYVDGKETPILRVDHAFRGVYLPHGQYRVEFVYAGEVWLWGGLVSLAAVLACAVLLWRSGHLSDRKGAVKTTTP